MDLVLLGQHIRRIRNKRHLTQAALAEYCGLSRASIANIERGHHRVHVDTLCDIADMLEIKASTLIELGRAG